MIESFRNRLWADYKTGAGIEPALLAQFHPLEEALAAMGVVVWPMIELEADDALASAAHLASKDKKVEKVAIWTPDKDLAQCVRGTRVVQIDGRRKTIRDAAGIREKFGVDPPLIPDLLALVGDAADGYPGIPGIGARTAAQLLNRYGPIENFPSNVLGEQRDLALLFKKLATLRTDAPLFKKVETLRWRGATPAFAAWADRMEAPRLLERCEKSCGPMTLAISAKTNFFATHAGTSRTLPSFQMIIGKPRRRSSIRFLRVARRCASEATRASGDILLSGISFNLGMFLIR